ncbi:glutathione S-transferase PARB-like [Cucurbita maxima]|uniref:glutathione transferase n=1 Tax=Cucurbita maxima TaxID=3661 RepID=A0A6J1KR11_CUCMA|nr:glutathione S-transferase PARB-like [Cucurbita maxima]
MATSIRVHGVPFSGPTCRVLACLYEKELEYEFVKLKMHEGEHKKQPFLSINPFGQVPGFQDGDLTLFESRAITQYIVGNYANNGTQLIFQDPKKAAIVLTWIEVESHHYDPPASKLVLELCLKPLLGWGETDAAVVEQSEAELAKVLDIYEDRLAQSKYLGGESFTLADLHHLPTIDYLFGTQMKKLFESRPHVNAWAVDIMARPAWAKVLALR